IATGFGQTHAPKQLSSKLSTGMEPKRPGTAYPAYGEQKGLSSAEPFRDAGYGSSAVPDRQVPPERYAPPERVVGFQDRLAKAADEVPPARSPYAKPGFPAQAPGKAGFGHIAPAPRDDENRVLFNDSQGDAQARKIGAPGPAHKGRYKDLDPDIDYETPAFLRNQAD